MTRSDELREQIRMNQEIRKKREERRERRRKAALMRFRVGLAMLALALLWGFIALWWWALVGMSEDIGTAHGFASGGLVLVGITVTVTGLEA